VGGVCEKNLRQYGANLAKLCVPKGLAMEKTSGKGE